jgi:methyl-accepting chemotaxis protein
MFRLAEMGMAKRLANLRAAFDAIRPDVASFSAFITGFVKAAAANKTSVTSRTTEIADRNHVVDDQLGALNDQVNAEIVRQRAAMCRQHRGGRQLRNLVGGFRIN